MKATRGRGSPVDATDKHSASGQAYRTHTVRTEPDQDTLLKHFQDWRDPDGIIHVGFGIMDNDRSGSGDNIHFILIDMDAMDENGLLASGTQLVQAIDDRCVVFL